MKLSLVLVGLVVASCATSEQYMLRHPQTGQIVECGNGGPSEGAAARTAKECMHEYQEQGFEKVK